MLIFRKKGSSPNSLVEDAMKTRQRPGRKGPPQADAASIGGIFFSISTGLAFRKAQRGPEKQGFGGTKEPSRPNPGETGAL